MFLSRGSDSTRRVLRNRVEVETRMAKLGFLIFRPETMPFREQVATLGAADVVVGESGAAMGGIGFCQPGTKVVEIQPECFLDGWTRGMCFQFAHRWHVYLARVEPLPDVDSDRYLLDPNGPFSYEIDPDNLARAVETVIAA